MSEIGIEGNEARRSLEEGLPASIISQTIERVLTIARRQTAAARQTNRRCIKRINRYIALIGFLDRSFEIDGVRRTRNVEASRSVETIRDEQHRLLTLPTR